MTRVRGSFAWSSEAVHEPGWEWHGNQGEGVDRIASKKLQCGPEPT